MWYLFSSLVALMSTVVIWLTDSARGGTLNKSIKQREAAERGVKSDDDDTR